MIAARAKECQGKHYRGYWSDSWVSFGFVWLRGSYSSLVKVEPTTKIHELKQSCLSTLPGGSNRWASGQRCDSGVPATQSRKI